MTRLIAARVFVGKCVKCQKVVENHGIAGQCLSAIGVLRHPLTTYDGIPTQAFIDPDDRYSLIGAHLVVDY